MSDVALSPPAGSPLLDVAHATPPTTLGGLLRTATLQSGKGPGALAQAYAKLAFAPGRPSFADFIKLRLFDDGFHPGAALDAFVGARRNRDLCVTINHRHDWLGLLSNKVAALSYLSTYGFPTLPILAVFAPGIATGAPLVLPDRQALAAFLREPARYPLFGKPVESFQSLGSIGLLRLDVATGCVERLDGRSATVDSLVEEIATHYEAGYLIQGLAAPHPEIAALCGPRLATVRMVTMLTEEGPRLFRAAWKIPSGGHAADNFWRPGNLLAALDLDEGQVRRTVSGSGVNGREVAAHPDTGVALTGLRHPSWDAMRRLALDAARLMRHVPLIGWDIACTDAGPTIVEMNETPDFFLVQYAEGRGVLDDDFKRFAAYQGRRAAANNAAGKAALRKL